jgi:signal transduction histidine kinase
MTGRRTGAGRQADMVNRARRVITVQIAATVTFLVLLAGVVALIVVAHDQSANERQQLARMASEPMIADPPPHAWEFSQTRAAVSGTKGAPAELPVRAAMDESAAHRETIVAGYRIGGVDYLIRTQPLGDQVIQVALDLSPQERERDELYAAVVLFETAGLAAVVVTGRLLSRRAMAPLGQVMERQSRFVADASHELRTPLTQLHTRAQLLQHRLDRDSSVTLTQEELDEILASTRQFGDVIEDVLRSSQLRHEPRLRAPVDLGVIVAGVAAAEAPRAEAAGISISVLNDPSARDLIVAGVGPALRRALGALVDNALTHTAAGGHIEVRVSAGADRQQVEVSVRDDGVGFLTSDSERLFARSTHREDGAGQRFGIGLALVREIVESHGGVISASGQPGQGADFTIRLPVAGGPLRWTRPRAWKPGGSWRRTRS